MTGRNEGWGSGDFCDVSLLMSPHLLVKRERPDRLSCPSGRIGARMMWEGKS